MKPIFLAAVIAAISIAPAALAKPGEGHGKGHHHVGAAEPSAQGKGWESRNGAVTNPAGRRLMPTDPSDEADALSGAITGD